MAITPNLYQIALESNNIFTLESVSVKKQLSSQEQTVFIELLKTRFNANPQRHQGIAWEHVEQKLHASPHKLRALFEMEKTGGEPDVVGFDADLKAYIFFDCSTESPSGRRSLCYDKEALDARKANKPKDNIVDVAMAIGVDILNEDEYQYLQTLGNFDTKTSSWLKTPQDIRKLDGAIFGDYRFGRVFIYHNGVQSYYAARGFRGSVRI